MNEPISTHGLIIGFGKHIGALWTRVPVSYLNWLANQQPRNGNTKNIDTAKAELKRRGSSMPKLDISRHAINRAVSHCLDLWRNEHEEGELFCDWIERRALQAYNKTNPIGDAYYDNGLKFIIEEGCTYPFLKTIMRSR